MWDLIVSVPDHCLSFYLAEKENVAENFTLSASKIPRRLRAQLSRSTTKRTQ